MNKVKKFAGYFLITFLVIVCLAGVYYFVTKGYGSDNNNLTSAVKNIVTGNSDDKESSEEMGSVTSGKISLVVTTPQDGEKLTSTSIKVTGKTSPKAEVFVNDQEGVADANGNFSIAITLEEGQNQIVVSVNDNDGNVAEKSLTVNVSTFE